MNYVIGDIPEDSRSNLSNDSLSAYRSFACSSIYCRLSWEIDPLADSIPSCSDEASVCREENHISA